MGSEIPPPQKKKTIKNTNTWLPFCQKLMEIQTKMSRFWAVRFSNGLLSLYIDGSRAVVV